MGLFGHINLQVLGLVQTVLDTSKNNFSLLNFTTFHLLMLVLALVFAFILVLVLVLVLTLVLSVTFEAVLTESRSMIGVPSILFSHNCQKNSSYIFDRFQKKTQYIVLIRVSNRTGQCNFSGQRDRQKNFVPGQRDNGTEVPSLSRDKGTTGQPQNLTTGRDGPGQPKFGTGRAGTVKSGTGRGTKRDRAEKDVLKQKNDVLKQKMLF